MPGPGPNPPSATSAYTRRSADGQADAERRSRRASIVASSAGAGSTDGAGVDIARSSSSASRVAGLVHPAGLVRRHDVAQARAPMPRPIVSQAAEVEGAHRRRSNSRRPRRRCAAPGPPRGRGAAGSGRRDRGRPSSARRESAATSASSVARDARRGPRAGRPPRSAAGAASSRSYAARRRIRSRVRDAARRPRSHAPVTLLAAIGAGARIPRPNDGSVLWGCVVSTGSGCQGTRAEVPSGLVKQAANRSTCQQAACSRPRRLGGKVSVEAASPPRAVEASLSGGAARKRSRTPERSPI